MNPIIQQCSIDDGSVLVGDAVPVWWFCESSSQSLDLYGDSLRDADFPGSDQLRHMARSISVQLYEMARISTELMAKRDQDELIERFNGGDYCG